ncbi:MAG: DUF5060 domain-containing protein, partial [bacterium]
MQIITFLNILMLFTQNSPEIPLYDIFEVEFSHCKTGNPFDIEISAVFSNKNTCLKVDGFYAGNNKYKIRFMPEKLGVWNYITASSVPILDGKIGKFKAVKSGLKGMIRVDSKNANTMHHFVHANGDRFFYQGNTAKCLFGTPKTYPKLGGWKDFLDYCSNYHFNHIIIFLYSSSITTSSSAAMGMSTMPGKPPSQYAYNRNGKVDYWLCPWASKRNSTKMAQFDYPSHSLTASDDIDFNCFYIPYWDKVDTIVTYMKSKNIIANIFFHPDDSYHPLEGKDEDRYFKYTIARLSAHWNVSYNLGLEYREYRTDDWANNMGDKVKGWDPYGHILSIHDQLKFRFKDKIWADYIVYQATPGTDGNQYYSEDYSVNKPMVNDECGYEPELVNPDSLIHIIWEMIMRNTYNSYGNVMQMGMNFSNLKDKNIAAEAHKYLVEFFKNTRWYEMCQGDGRILIHPSKTEAILYRSLDLPSELHPDLISDFMDIKTGERKFGGRTPDIVKPPEIGDDFALHVSIVEISSSEKSTIDELSYKNLVNDDFTTAMTFGVRSQGQGILDKNGWNIDSTDCQIKYDLGKFYTNGIVEFDVKGPLSQSGKRILFAAWNEESAEDGDRKTQGFFQIRVQNHGMMLRLTYRPGGRSFEGYTGRLKWDREKLYHIKANWNTQNGTCNLWRDEKLLISGKFNAPFDGFRWCFIGKDNYKPEY